MAFYTESENQMERYLPPKSRLSDLLNVLMPINDCIDLQWAVVGRLANIFLFALV